VFLIHRKKIAMITHAKSIYTFFIPYAAVGGAKAIPECIKYLKQMCLFGYPIFSQTVNHVHEKKA